MSLEQTNGKIHIYIYIYAFSRRFYPKRLTLHSSFYILSALAFPGNRTHDLGVANAMLYQLSYRKALIYIYIYIYTSGGPLSALTCCVNVRLLSAIKKISPLIYSQSWLGSWVYTTQAMMTFTLIF